MTSRLKADLEPAFLLHSRPYLESSVIADFFTRGHGRLSLVAKGARRPVSKLRGILQPFCRLCISFTQRSDLGTLTGADADDRPVNLGGDGLMGAFYLNELLIRLLHRNDAQTALFAVYQQALKDLAEISPVAPVLRVFEKQLLELLGYGLELRKEVTGDQAIEPDLTYEYRLEEGPVRTDDGCTSGLVFSGSSLIALAREDLSESKSQHDARRLLTAALELYLGDRPLRTRKVMRDLRR